MEEQTAGVGLNYGRGERESITSALPEPEIVMKISEALEKKATKKPFSDSIGRISREFVYLYPPGIPVIAPGERIKKEIFDVIMWYRDMGMSVQGIADPALSSIITVADE